MSTKKQSEINVFFNIAKRVIELKNEKETKEELRVKYALSKVSKGLKGLVEDFAEKRSDIALDFCSVDSEKNVIVDDKGGYKFTAENQKKFNKKVNELLNEEHEVKTHFVSIPKGYSPSAIEIFTGFIFSEEEVERYEESIFGENLLEEAPKLEVVDSE